MRKYQIIFYVPETHLEKVKQAMFNAGGGLTEKYEQSCWQTKGEGQFKPKSASQPFIGNIGELSKVVEYKVEMIASKEKIKNVVEELKKHHPYECPAMSVFEILEVDLE